MGQEVPHSLDLPGLASETDEGVSPSGAATWPPGNRPCMQPQMLSQQSGIYHRCLSGVRSSGHTHHQ